MSGTWYYTWSKKIVKDSKLIPAVPHYVVMVYKDHRYSEAGWDAGDSSTSACIRTSDYYAFLESEKLDWEKMISDIYTEKHTLKPYHSYDNEDYVFFKSSGRITPSVKIDVNV